MALLRFVTVTCLAALLLAPFLKLFEQTVQDPVVLIAHDNSTSIGEYLSGDDSTAYMQEISALSSGLDRKFTVEHITFGAEIEREGPTDFTAPVTDLGQAMDYVGQNYADQNLAAVVVATDGLYNRGKNPLYAGQRLGVPVHIVALGDTTPKVDLTIQQVLHNRISFLGDRFPVQVDIAATRLAGRKATISVQRISGGATTTLVQESLDIDRDDFFTTRQFVLDADQAGINRYRVRVSGISGEEQYANNVKDFYIEVIDGRLEVLVLGSAPHPDMSAFRELISENENYNVTVSLFDDFEANIADFDLVVLHQLPDNKTNINTLLTAMNNAGVPRIFIVGDATGIARFNEAQGLMRIDQGSGNSNEVTAIVNPQFQLFTVPENFEQQIRSFAPLNAPFGEYTVDPGAHVYLYQRIGNVDTRFPLIVFGESAGVKTGVIAAEGLWKWRLFDYLQNSSHELTNNLVNKAIQYVTVKDDKRKFRAEPVQKLFSNEEQISFTAELYNQTYELVNDPDVFLVIRDAGDKEYSYTFNKTDQSYAISVGRFAVGEYTYTAFTDYAGQRQTVNGKFNVQEIQLESYITTADHSLLYAIAGRYGGEVYYPGETNRLMESLLGDEELRPVIYQSAQSSPLLHVKWIFFVFLAMLAVEWFMRRFFGGY